MAQININNRVLENVNKDDLIKMLNEMIDNELVKDVDDIDTVFVDECVDALLELEQEQNNFAAIVPLMSSDKFLKRLTADGPKTFKNLNVFARVAIIAAIIAGSTFTANATVQSITGVNVIETVAQRIEQRLGLSIGIEDIDVGFDDDDEETTTAPPTTKPTAVPTTTTTTKPPASSTTTTTKPTTTKFHGIEDIDVGFEDDDEETTTTTTKPTTTRKPVPPTTAKPITPPVTKDDEVVFAGVEAEFDNFKTDYVYGEELTYEGLTLTEVFSDGTRKPLPLEKCNYTRSVDMTKTADYTLRIIYKTSIIEIEITVRPDDDTRGGEVCSNELYDYYLTKNGAYITAYRGNESVIELDEIDGNPVIAIGEGVFNDKNVERFTARNVKKIFSNAFRNCCDLTQIDISSAEYIGNNAFEGCMRLSNPSFSDSLYYLGTAVYKDSGIEQITIPSLITEIPSALCNNCSELKTVNLSGKVTTIGISAFSECKALEKVNGAENITRVEAFGFYEDELMELDNQPKSLEAVGDYAFAHCTKVNITRIGKELNELGKGSFSYCYKLAEVELDGSIEVVPYGAFQGAHIESLTLNEGTRVISDYAFMSIMTKTLTLPASVTTIGSNSFYITFLRQAYFDKNIVEIAESAFYRSSRLTFYVYEDTVPYDYAIEHSVKYELL